MSRTQIDSSLVPSASTSIQNISNILDNGGFDIWQRGTTFTNIANAYVADRWNWGVSVATPTATITKELSNTDGKAAALKIVVTNNAGNNQAYFTQTVENYANLKGKTITVTIRSQQSATGYFIGIYDGVTATSTALGVNAVYTTYSVTATISASATQLFVFWGNNTGPTPIGTFYLASAMMTIGSTVIPFVPTNLEVDLSRCQRFFYRMGGGLNVPIGYGQCANTTIANLNATLPVSMRTTPTLTVNNPTNFYIWGATQTVLNCTNITGQGAGFGANGTLFGLQPTVASGIVAGNATALWANNSNATLDFSADF